MKNPNELLGQPNKSAIHQLKTKKASHRRKIAQYDTIYLNQRLAHGPNLACHLFLQIVLLDLSHNHLYTMLSVSAFTSLPQSGLVTTEATWPSQPLTSYRKSLSNSDTKNSLLTPFVIGETQAAYSLLYIFMAICIYLLLYEYVYL